MEQALTFTANTLFHVPFGAIIALKTSLLPTMIKVRFLQFLMQNEQKSSKIRVNQGFEAVQETAPKPFFHFQSRKTLENAGVPL